MRVISDTNRVELRIKKVTYHEIGKIITTNFLKVINL